MNLVWIYDALFALDNSLIIKETKEDNTIFKKHSIITNQNQIYVPFIANEEFNASVLKDKQMNDFFPYFKKENIFNLKNQTSKINILSLLLWIKLLLLILISLNYFTKNLEFFTKKKEG